MKRILYLIPLVALMAACKGGNNPEKAATDFLTAVKEKKWDRALELSTKAYQSEVTFGRDFYPDSVFVTEIKDLKCTVNGETAECTFCCLKNGNASDTKVKLVKEDKKWKVAGGVRFVFDDPVTEENTDNGKEEVTEITEKVADSLSNDLDKALEDLDAELEKLEKSGKKSGKKK